MPLGRCWPSCPPHKGDNPVRNLAAAPIQEMKMRKVDTGSPIIARYDHVVSHEECNSIIDYLLTEKAVDKIVKHGMPWENSDNLSFIDVKDKKVRAMIDRYRFTLTQLVYETYREIAYPHFSDLVVWRKDMEMGFHKDNGYEGSDQNIFRIRKYSAILYLNDNYLGGETVIKQENKPDFVSVPKQGSVTIFKSNEECFHGVNQIKKGTRYTIASWFSTDIYDCEVVDNKIQKGKTMSKLLTAVTAFALFAFVSPMTADAAVKNLRECNRNLKENTLTQGSCKDSHLSRDTKTAEAKTSHSNGGGNNSGGNDDDNSGNNNDDNGDDNHDDHGNNGHGNDDDHNDDSNPGNSNNSDDHTDDDGSAGHDHEGHDGDHGHGGKEH